MVREIAREGGERRSGVGIWFEVVSSRIPAIAVSPATSMQTALETRTHDHQLASRRHYRHRHRHRRCSEGISQRGISQRGITRPVSSAAARPNGIGRCEGRQKDRAGHMRGLRDPSGQSLEMCKRKGRRREG
jgi:hypothetical protein